MRGRTRLEVGAVLLAAATATGALAGWAFGVAWLVARLPAGGTGVALGAGVVALGADRVHRRGRGPRPPSVSTQVPQVWSRLFDPRTVAALYGARLGVGPLTILRTWTWWAAAVVGASNGPGPGAVAGGAFGAVRVLVLLAAARAAATPGGMAGLRRREGPAVAVAAALAVGAAVLLSG